MHPEMLRLMAAQRGQEMRTQAHQARLVRMIRSARRGHHLPDKIGEFELPPIPDYVDGSFHADGTGAGHAPVAQRAA
jgi:hypothetical protein